jgi:dipeptidyl-peptidase III
LGNVLSAKAPNEKIPFIRPEDLELYKKYRDGSFEVQVGLHELTGEPLPLAGHRWANPKLTLDTGHGCGKLLQETAPGEFNFDKENPPKSPLTNAPIKTWYKVGETWGSLFGGLAGAYEVSEQHSTH